MLAAALLTLFITVSSAHASPRRSSSRAQHALARARPHISIPPNAAGSFSSPSSLWPLPVNVSIPPNPNPCTWSPLLNDTFIPGCAGGGSQCSSYPTLELAQAACAVNNGCAGVTSQSGGAAPWETRAGPKPAPSPSGELSYIITNGCHSSGSGACFALPPTFSIISAGFSDGVLDRAMARYAAIINTAYANTTVLPPNASTIASLVVTVASADDTLRLGVDESYTLDVSAAGATLEAQTVWGALRGLETMSQLSRHTWTTDASGAINASFNEVCATLVTDAPRFPLRGLMLDTARHFLPVDVIKQVIDLMSYLKMNALRLHLVDTDAWSYYVPGLPVVSNTSAYSPLHVYYPGDLAALVAWGRDRGVVVYPEVDFPFHASIILDSIPELGCLTPGPDASRQFIDPLFPDLWPTMAAVFAGLNAVFPPEYPFHMGGDEVDRNAWATCPSVVAWGASLGVAPADLPRAIADWWYTSLYNFLAAPPFSRTVMAWEDASDAVNGSWVGAATGGLVLEQWNGDPGVWNWDTCALLQANASVLVAGPFHDVIGGPPSFNSDPAQNYADIFNLTCPITPRVAQQLVGPELMFWDDAADISASDLILMLMSAVVPVAESGWSQQAVVAPGVVAAGRYGDLRCRLARRGMQSHDAYGHVGTFCVPEYHALLMPWSM